MEWKTGCTDPPVGPSPYVATLTFDMESPAGENAHRLATGAVGMARALTEIQEQLRQIGKYEDVGKMDGEKMLSRAYAIVADAINENCRDTLEAYQ